MNKKIIRYIAFSLLAVLLSISSFAQDTVEMADTMRSNGKIYVVVTVCLVILIGLFVYITSIDRKVRRLEKEMKQNGEAGYWIPDTGCGILDAG